MKSSESSQSKGSAEKEILEARIACYMRLNASVDGAEFPIPIHRFTKVLAREEGPDDFTIVWPYGVASAEARVTKSVLIF